ncbi:glycosyltransferase [Moritella sp.]|uniref:glycosyltransferase family 2 protein n=1 Tax=Moritella sp. TaxID=78556 RepID=UPI001DB469A7|nr:glycosyltransferase [Moritella sp.]MCJ8347968.1 glycosyltransferase [Moritella sp.]NQZ40359.1 glycosyltransferase [Moritella sp.]
MTGEKLDILVSVIIPVYNASKYIHDALSSVCNQTYKNLEIIVIDDGSSDDSLSKIKYFSEIDSRVKVLSRENKGLIYTLNEAISIASGKYISRMDADDISSLDRIEKQVDILELGFDICGCHFHVIDEQSNLMHSIVVSTNPDYQAIILSRSVPFAHGSVTFRRSFLENNGLSYVDDKFISAEDYFLWVRFYESGAKITNVDEYLFYYRDFSLSLSNVNKTSNLLDAIKISNYFINKNFHEIESIVDKLNHYTNNKRLNSFELEQLGYYVFKTFFRRKLGKTFLLIKSLPLNIVLLSALRVVKYLIAR